MSYRKTINNRISKNKLKLLKSLNENKGNISKSCLNLGIHRSTLYRWLKTDEEFRKKVEEGIWKGKKFKGDQTLYQVWKSLKLGGVNDINFY